ncbi:MAG: putative ABC exporter domain-containing protein [Gammaproteobacteria bacterium]
MLAKLLLLRLRGGVRQRLKELKTLRGLLFLLVTMAVIALLLNQSSMPATPLGSFFSGDIEQQRKQIAQLMPTGLLAAFLLMTVTSPGPGLYFSPSEINLLFSGPFTRRALVLYKLCFYAFGAFLSSLLIMLLVPAVTYTPTAAFLSAFLTLMFIQLLTVAAGLLGQLLRRYFYPGARWGYVIIPLIFLIAATGLYSVDVSGGMDGALARFRSSLGGAAILAPFEVFAHIFLAKSIFPDLLGWTALGLALNIGLLAVVIVLDGRSLEASTAASLELHKRWERARRSGLPWGAQPAIARPSIRPPLFGGMGPLAWRQMLSAFRNSRKALLVYLSMAALAGPFLVIAGAGISLWSLLGGVFFAAVFVLPRTLVFDFRSDLDIMENFKALPMPPWKISLGQLASPVLLTSLIEGVLLGSAAVFLDGKPRVFIIGIGPFLAPFNLLLYGLENLFFLLFPAPLVPVGRADFDFLGRTMVGFAVTAIILMISCFLAAIAGQAAANIMGWPWQAFVAVAWLSLTLIALMTLPLLSWAFDRFDVSLR